MKKIPTLFERVFENHKIVEIKPVVAPGMEWVLEGKGTATIKFDGACCAVIDGKLYKRYDAKLTPKGTRRVPPKGAIPCGYPDPITGHWPHWVLVDPELDHGDKWFAEAFRRSAPTEDGTYEVIGPAFRRNPHKRPHNVLIKHGIVSVTVPRTFEGIREYLRENAVEGLVFWKDGEPRCKIKRRDFGFEWPVE